MLPVLRNNSVLAPFATRPFHRFDSLFDHVFGNDGGFMNQAWSEARVAMWEDDDHIFIEADLPGVSDKDVDVTVHNGTLFIRGERKPEGNRRYLYESRLYGRFERIVTLPEAVKTDEVQATLTNGVLRIELPKSPEAKPKKITLKAS